MAVGVVVMLVTAAVAILLVDPLLALVGFLIFPAIAVLNFVYQRRLAPLVMRAQQLRAEVSEIAHESFDGALVVKTLGREDAETARFQAKADELRDSNIAVGRVRGLFDPLLEALPTLGVLAVLLFGSMRLAAGGVSSGRLIQVSYLFTLLAFPIRALGWVLAELPRSVVGWTTRAGRAQGDRLDGVRRHPARRAPVPPGWRSGGSATATRRTPPCWTGSTSRSRRAARSRSSARPVRASPPSPSSSSGWSTPTAAGFCSTGPTCARWPGARSATAVSLVPQQTFLFDDTVRGNVNLGTGGADSVPDEEVWAALRLAQAEGFVSALPKGLDTRVGERGTTLSGGQRQRLALARALVRTPRLLVLDDATSSVDPQVEGRILHGLRDAVAGLDGARRRLPHGDHRAGRRGRLPGTRPGGRPGAARRCCSPGAGDTATWSPPTNARRRSAPRSPPTRRSRHDDAGGRARHGVARG